MDEGNTSGASIPHYVREHGFLVTCYSFQQVIEVLETKQIEDELCLRDVAEISKKNQTEYEACANFSEALLAVNVITVLSFKHMILNSTLLGFITKGLAEYEEFRKISFENIKLVSSENAVAIGNALKQRKPSESFTLSLIKGDVSLIEPLMEASAVLGGKLELKNLDVASADSTRCLRRWTLNASNVTSLQLSYLSGLSDMSLVTLMKGLRNVSNLSILKLNNTKCSPESLIILEESLSIVLEKYQGNRFCLDLGNTGLNDAAVWKISELFLDHNKIKQLHLDNIESSMAKTIVSARMITNPNLNSVFMQNVTFLKESEFNILYRAIASRKDCPSVFLSPGCVADNDFGRLSQLYS